MIGRDRPSLLVSVRSAAEATEAIAGGAAIIDVKEPDRGALGMADPTIWQEVRAAVPGQIPVSVALGELGEWLDRPTPPQAMFEGITFRKIGLANASDRWAEDWADLRQRLGDGPRWIAVIYADWKIAKAPDPQAVIAAAEQAGCAGVLIDTWDKSRSAGLDSAWQATIQQIKSKVGIVALAGGLDARGIARIGRLEPNIIAVRGAACHEGDRRGIVEAERVAMLVRACGARPLSR